MPTPKIDYAAQLVALIAKHGEELRAARDRIAAACDAAAADDDDEAEQPCRMECSCPTQREHDAAVAESLRDFLRDPGPPPAGMHADAVARAWAGIEAARKKAGM